MRIVPIRRCRPAKQEMGAQEQQETKPHGVGESSSPLMEPQSRSWGGAGRPVLATLAPRRRETAAEISRTIAWSIIGMSAGPFRAVPCEGLPSSSAFIGFDQGFGRAWLGTYAMQPLLPGPFAMRTMTSEVVDRHESASGTIRREDCRLGDGHRPARSWCRCPGLWHGVLLIGGRPLLLPGPRIARPGPRIPVPALPAAARRAKPCSAVSLPAQGQACARRDGRESPGSRPDALESHRRRATDRRPQGVGCRVEPTGPRRRHDDSLEATPHRVWGLAELNQPSQLRVPSSTRSMA